MFGFTKISLYNDEVHKKYFVGEDDWERVKNNHLTMVKLGVGVDIISINEETETIIMKNVNILESRSLRNNKDLALELKLRIDELHSLGYCHGDIKEDNVGRDPTSGKLVFIDLDTIHHIENDRNSDWLRDLMWECYDLDIDDQEDYDYYVQRDYFSVNFALNNV